MEKIEEKTEIRRRLEKWVKLFLLFLALMWLCTIISKSIYVSMLPRVTVQAPEKKYIEHIVTVDGIVTAGGERAVNTAAGLRVAGVHVREGDEVAAGTVLFSLDLDDLDAIISEKETGLAKLQYQLSDKQFNEILDSQKKEVARLWAQEDYDNADRETTVGVERAQKALADAEANLGQHLGTDAPHTSDSARESAWDAYNKWKKRYYELVDMITAKEREIKDLEERLSQPAGSGDTQEKAELEQALKAANAELAALKDDLTRHERNTVPQPDYSAEESAYDSWQQTKAALEDAVEAAQQSLEDAKYARESTLRQKRRDLASAQAYSPADSTSAIYGLEIAQMQAEIGNLKLLKGQKGEVKAEYGGFVSKVLIQTGGRTSDTAAVLLTDEEAPCQFKCSITKEEGKYIQLGNSVTLKINGKGSKGMDAEVDYLAENMAGGYDVICRLPEGAAKPGVGGLLTRKVQGEQHTLTIPADALYKESEAYFIYTYNEKTGILGSEFYAERIKVQVADINERYAALEDGIISPDTQVITFCSDMLKQGERVRLAE